MHKTLTRLATFNNRVYQRTGGARSWFVLEVGRVAHSTSSKVGCMVSYAPVSAGGLNGRAAEIRKSFLHRQSWRRGSPSQDHAAEESRRAHAERAFREGRRHYENDGPKSLEWTAGCWTDSANR